ncbi:MAG: hypothetical protein JO323_09880 [Acidobacteriia bacterium]|nr:hypothetical protein [Terriglobia bacterium]
MGSNVEYLNAEDELRGDLNNTGIEFLLTDLDMALTFMDIAAISQIQETVDRNHENARDAYDTVLRLLQNLTPDTDQRSAIDHRMGILKARLEAVGCQF